MTLVDWTDPALEAPPFLQSIDQELCSFTFDTLVTKHDVLELQLRETFGGPIIGTLTSGTQNFAIDVSNNNVRVWLREEQTRKWFKDAKITDTDTLKTLTGTLLHKDRYGKSYPWSGEYVIKFALQLSYTRG